MNGADKYHAAVFALKRVVAIAEEADDDDAVETVETMEQEARDVLADLGETGG